MGLPLRSMAENDADAQGVGEYKSLPVGEYLAVVDAFTDTDDDGNPLRTSPTSPKVPNAPMVKFTFRVIEDGDYIGERIFRRYILQGKSLGFLLKDLTALGLSEAEQNDLDADAVLDRECIIVVGKPKKVNPDYPDSTEVKFLKPATAGAGSAAARSTDDVPF